MNLTHLNDQVETFKVGVFAGIWNFELVLRLIYTCLTYGNYFFVDIQIVLGFLFPNNTLHSKICVYLKKERRKKKFAWKSNLVGHQVTKSSKKGPKRENTKDNKGMY